MKDIKGVFKLPPPGDQRGFSMLSMVLSLLVICVLIAIYVTVISKRMGVSTGKGEKATVADTRSMAADSGCSQAIGNIAKMVEIYRASSGNYPSGVDELTAQNPQLAQTLADSSLWVENGSPSLDSSESGFTVVGYCASGNQYSYDSAGGAVTSKPF